MGSCASSFENIFGGSFAGGFDGGSKVLGGFGAVFRLWHFGGSFVGSCMGSFAGNFAGNCAGSLLVVFRAVLQALWGYYSWVVLWKLCGGSLG
jgi:hypothetical protein